MSVLVAHASTHGATEGIAEEIAEGVTAAGQAADARPIWKAGEVAGFQGFVIGAAHSTSWLKDLEAFVKSNQDFLLKRPAWLFSGDPACGDATAVKGVSSRQTCESEELSGFQVAIGPRDHGIFFHSLDRHKISGGESAYPRALDMYGLQPDGDFPKWTQVVEPAQGIGEELTDLAAQRRQESVPITERTGPHGKRTHPTPNNRWESRPTALVSTRRTTKMGELGTAFFALLGLLGASLTLVIAWSSFGLQVAGFSAVALTAGVAVFALEAKWLFFVLDKRASAESDWEKW